MDRLLRLGAGSGMQGFGQSTPNDAPMVDTAEQVYISSLALLKVRFFVSSEGFVFHFSMNRIARL